MINIKSIIDMLNSEVADTSSLTVAIAKGKYKQPDNWAEFKNYFKLRNNGK